MNKKFSEYQMCLLTNASFTVAQAAMNVAAAVGACSAPLIIGALTKANPHTGWRNFYVGLFDTHL